MPRSSSRPHRARSIETVNLSPFRPNDGHILPKAERLKAGNALVEALHSFGFAKVIGHGLGKQEIDEALSWTKRLFDLPIEEKMKAPHPAGSMPHRGYSGVGKEKLYSHADVAAHGSGRDFGEELRKISDFKV